MYLLIRMCLTSALMLYTVQKSTDFLISTVLPTAGSACHSGVLLVCALTRMCLNGLHLLLEFKTKSKMNREGSLQDLWVYRHRQAGAISIELKSHQKVFICLQSRYIEDTSGKRKKTGPKQPAITTTTTKKKKTTKSNKTEFVI